MSDTGFDDDPMPAESDVWGPPGSIEDFGCETPPPRITSLADSLSRLRDHLERGEPPVMWTPAAEPWGNLAFVPYSVMTIGSPPATGKTSLVLDVNRRMLTRYPELRVLVASNEMRTEVMVERILAMHSGIDYGHLRRRDRGQYTPADIERATAVLEQFGQRLAFVERPFTLEQISAAARDHRADIVFVDFLQATESTVAGSDIQQGVAHVMRSLRALADTGPCVVTTAAMSRQGIAHARMRVGKTDCNEADMGVFLHASEIEHMTNVAYLLLAEPGAKVAVTPDEPYEPIPMWLQCVKAREDVKVHVPLLFDGRHQTFTLRDPSKPANARKPIARPAQSPPRGKQPIPMVATGSIPKESVENGRWL